jgi:pseudaminic acid biosynthesis-associated methylase
MISARSDQEGFWAETYAEEYIRKNSSFDLDLGVEAWRKMLANAAPIESLLECGCNIGRNLRFLSELLPGARKSGIEISEPAFHFVSREFGLDQAFNGAIVDAPFEPGSFDLVFTTGVMIHVHPDNLLANMRKMFDLSRRYILIGEYFNRTPVMLEYQGEKDRLFKRDFGKDFILNHDVDLVDYGFLWGHIYDPAGFDDVTWWLFEKR